MNTSSSSGAARCLDCCKSLCSGCAAAHRQTPVTSTHSLYDPDLVSAVLQDPDALSCLEHRNETVGYYCVDCERCVCVLCTFDCAEPGQSHHQHDIVDFNTAVSRSAAFSRVFRNVQQLWRRTFFSDNDRTFGRAAVRLSVCSSVRPSSSSVTNVLWLTGRSYGKNIFARVLALCYKPRHAKLQSSSARETFSNSGLNKGAWENVHFQRKTGNISETVKDTAKVTINH